jgi:probable HAF family extracellular repeat protein
MNVARRLRNFWIPVTTIVLACFSNAVGQVSYRVTDLGSEGKDNLGCAMSVNDEGWTEIMAGSLPPGQQDSLSGTLLNGRALIDIDGIKLDLGTLGGKNSWMNWGEINDYAQVVGYSETAVPDPNGEDVCGFGTHATCRPFIWQLLHMSALPTLGGNNGQASAINNSGQVVGFAENGAVDSSCPPGITNNRVDLPVSWTNGRAHALPTVGSDPDGVAYWINDQGQSVGYSGTCTAALHAVSWKNNTVTPLADLGNGGIAQGNNNRGQIVGQIGSADGSTFYAAVWQNGVLTNLYTLPGDVASLASGDNDQGQVVGSTVDSSNEWSHGFIWQNNLMTDLNTLFPANSNLYAVMANKINASGQISGMAIVMSGADKGNIHAFLATPRYGSMGLSVADVAPTRPESNVPVTVSKQQLQRLGLAHFGH